VEIELGWSVVMQSRRSETLLVSMVQQLHMCL
jgi:hypothetical protein